MIDRQMKIKKKQIGFLDENRNVTTIYPTPGRGGGGGGFLETQAAQQEGTL